MIGRRIVRGLAIVALWTVLGTMAGLFVAVSAPYLFGYRSLTVLSGSMEPTLHVGDVVVVDQVSPTLVRVGDIVTFRDPADPARLITHRVREIHVSGSDVDFVTKGDANTSVERWKINRDGKIGRVAYHVWRLGYLMFWIRSRYGRLSLIVIPALVLGAVELWRLWRPAPAGPEPSELDEEEEQGDVAA